MFTTTYPAKLSNLRAFKDALAGYLQLEQVTPEKLQDIELTIEELLVNVMLYGYPKSDGDIELHGDMVEKKFIFQIIDQGVAFDPTTVSAPELGTPIENRMHGGMGIYLAKSLVESMTYKRTENKNILTLIFTIYGE